MKISLAVAAISLAALSPAAHGHSFSTSHLGLASASGRVHLVCDETVEQVEAEVKALQQEIDQLESQADALSKKDRKWLEVLRFELTIRLTTQAAGLSSGELKRDAEISKRQCFILDDES